MGKRKKHTTTEKKLSLEEAPVLNSKRVFTIVRLTDETIAIVDDSKACIPDKLQHVWKGRELVSVPVSGKLEKIALPPIPVEQYGAWQQKVIGGLSLTTRCIGLMRAKAELHDKACTVFAINAVDRESVAKCISEHPYMSNVVSVGDTELHDEYGFVTELVLHEAKYLGGLCAAVARCGATPILENEEDVNAKHAIGIERLDRIESEITTDCHTMHETTDGTYGMRRGTTNWLFPWLPDHWKPPLTWDHMVDNMSGVDIEHIPLPLRQHVARRRLEQGDYPAMGSIWKHCDAPDDGAWAAHVAQNVSNKFLQRIVDNPPPALVEQLISGTDGEEVVVTMCNDTPTDKQCRVQGKDSKWYRPKETMHYLTKYLKKDNNGSIKRVISANLTQEQKKQLITAFYCLCVEQTANTDLREASKLLLFRYMIERGYTARWMGKYEQTASYIGNGDTCRQFVRLSQYDPERLPTEALNRMCNSEGKLQCRGSKGSRSKYKSSSREGETRRYIPKRRLSRTEEQEKRMRNIE